MNNRLAFYDGTDYNRMFIRDEQFASVTELRQGLSLSNLIVCYTLATPVEIDLTELEVIETLKGVNNVWAYTGDVTVLYKNYEEVI